MISHFVVLSCLVYATVAQSNYCKISNTHTMCRFKGLGPQCGSVVSRGLSDAEKAEIVDLHNKLRSRVATGQESRGQPGPQGPAADMLEMVWDDEVASVAQRWADQCNFGHDQNRNVDRFKVGQNVYEATDFNEAPIDWKQPINSWYDEVKLVNNRQTDSFVFVPSTGHYTQMVWAKTNILGCGAISYKSGRFIKKYVVCNYGPSGNFLRAPIYTRGPACSACPAGTTCSKENPGLCKGSPVRSPIDVEATRPVDQTFVPLQPVAPIQPVVPLQPVQPIQSFVPIQSEQPFVPIPAPVQPAETFVPVQQGPTQTVVVSEPVPAQQGPSPGAFQPQPPLVLFQQPQRFPQNVQPGQFQGGNHQNVVFIQQRPNPGFSFLRPVNTMFNRFFTTFG